MKEENEINIILKQLEKERDPKRIKELNADLMDL